MNQENAYQKLVHLLNENVSNIDINEPLSYRPLLESIGDARLVLMGEASHGTREFYQARALLSQLLIKEKNFHAIAIEGDWTSAYAVHRYIQGVGNDATEALLDFKRFPAWMWRNEIMPPFLKWIRDYNDHLSHVNKIGFYGLDLYCLEEAIESVIDYLNQNEPEKAKIAMNRYACLDHNMDPQQYGFLTDAKLKKSCVREITQQLLEMQHLAFEKIRKNQDHESLFYATQNARLIKNAEHYYRALYEANEVTWNIRDEHMTETLQNLVTHLETKLNKPAKIIVWAHNSHVGDARATEMIERKEVNLGQLVREHFDLISFLIGFSTYKGTVTAAQNWGEEGECRTVSEGMDGSYEKLFHEVSYKNFLLSLHGNQLLKQHLNVPRLQRAIGVIYRPETERYSHYFFSRLPYQFDALIHLDETHAVKPLDVKVLA